MKIILLSVLLSAAFCLTGCETTVVERRPVLVRQRYYDQDYGYRDRRDVRIIRSDDGAYYRPQPYQRRDVVVVDNSPNYERSRYQTINRTQVVVKKDKRHDRREDDKKKKKKKKRDHGDDRD